MKAPAGTRSTACEAVAALAWAGKQQQAIERAAAELAVEQLPADERLRLLDLRAESHIALGRFADALADAKSMQQLAGVDGNPGRKARALCRLAIVQTRQGIVRRGPARARRTAAGIRGRGAPLFRLSEALWRSWDEGRPARRAGSDR
jgi:hypothetical protein